MKKAIYKITNKINGKIYIGQSKQPERRFREHCWKKEKYVSLIDRAIQKYGENNFDFDILGWFENYNEKEQEYIAFFKSFAPYGYNITKDGEEPPLHIGNDHPNAKITSEMALNIKKDLMNFNIPRKQIIKKYKITNDIVRHINDGRAWRDDKFNYPLRPQESKLNEIRANKVIELLQNTNLSHKEIGAIVGWNKSAVTMINIGKNHHKDNLTYPIRK